MEDAAMDIIADSRTNYQNWAHRTTKTGYGTKSGRTTLSTDGMDNNILWSKDKL